MLKSIKKYGILLLMAVVVLSSCIDKNKRKNNYPTPDINFTLPIGKVYTIDTLLQMQKPHKPVKFTEDASVYGIVTADETSSNLYKQSFIQDGDKAIELYMKSTSGLRMGDSVRVYLKGTTLSEYSGTPQIQDLDPNKITILANNKHIDPVVIATNQVNANYKCRLVRFENVEFRAADRENTFAPEDDYGQFNLAQYNDNCSRIDESIVVRTNSHASFASTQLPQGKGSITGIVTCYDNGTTQVYQFIIRSYSEVLMNDEPCEAPIN